MSQGKSRADQIAEQAAQVQKPEQVMAPVIGPLNSPASPSVPHRNKKMLRNAAMRKEAQAGMKKADKVLIPESQQCKLTKS